MAYAALTILLQSLDQYSHPNRNFFLVKNHQLQSLNENLKFLQEFLENCTNNCNHQEVMSSFEAKIRDLSYKAQDLIEEFIFENPCRSEKAIDIFDSQNSVYLTLQQILGEIDSIKAEAIEIRQTISADESMVKDLTTSREIEEYSSTQPEDIVVLNFDEGLKIIEDRLLSSSRRLEIVSFVGEDETGKPTSLAKLVHDHPLVANHFDFRVLITQYEEITAGRSIRRFLSTYYLKGERDSFEIHSDEERILEYSYKKLKSKRYLAILINAARSFEGLIDFESWFPENYKGSRVILANSMMGVTTSPCIYSPSLIHVIKCQIGKMLPKLFLRQKYKKRSFYLQKHLPKQNYMGALEYLFEKVFAKESCPRELISTAIQIVKNCQGVQKVLDGAARLLSESSDTPEDWEYVAKRIGYVSQIFFPDKVFYIDKCMPRLSKEKKQENAVVGIDGDLIKIKDHLAGGLPRLEIIAVLGMGGIGKTTLAKAVFDDPFIQYHFYVRAWIKVSHVYNLRALLLGLLQNLDPLANGFHTMDKEQLREKLYRRLKGQRFLIVMDDMWSTQAWDDLRRSFPDDRNGSRILLTSRLGNLADYVSSNYTHQMRFLNKYHSWKLLQQRIFLKESCPPELVDTGKKIAEKCKGLPLTIVVVAGVLSNMSNTGECWENVAKSMTTLKTGGPERYLRILAMSYNYLPQHLKACFLYLCVFPKDCEIEYWRLIQLWVAEGFVKPEGFRSLEERAEEYLEDLISRSLVLVGKRSSSGNIKTCCVHDLLRDLSFREAKRENFMHVITGQVQVPSEDSRTVRRLSLHSGSANFHSDHSIQLTHSLLCFDVGFDDIQMFLTTFKFKLLRVLDIGFMRFDYFPLVILRLVHLRFIALTAACDLPSFISELWNLQTVRVQGPWIRRKFGKSPTLPLEIDALKVVI